MTTAKKAKFGVELKFNDTVQMMMLQLALKEAIEKRQADQCSHNFGSMENSIRDLKEILLQVKNYKHM